VKISEDKASDRQPVLYEQSLSAHEPLGYIGHFPKKELCNEWLFCEQ